MTELIDGKYEVIEKIRDGGMGSIFKVRHVLLNEIRVMKTLRGDFQDSESAGPRFFREARLATSLQHPNIATVYDFAETPDHMYLMIMEYIHGRNLAELLSISLPPIEVALEISIQTLAALGYLHRRGIVHRDVSPDNLMVTKGDQGELLVKLIDLGLARAVSGADELTAIGTLVGKLSYMSPEQLGALHAGERIDARADIYSFGCVLYRLLTGAYAVEATTHQSFIMAHIHKPPRPFGESDPTGRVPSDLREAVNRSLEKDRRRRWSTAEEFRDALRLIQERLLQGGQPGLRLGAASGAGTAGQARDLLEVFPWSALDASPAPRPDSEHAMVEMETTRPAPLGPIPLEGRTETTGRPTTPPPADTPWRVAPMVTPASRPGRRTTVMRLGLAIGTAVLAAAALALLFRSKGRTEPAVGTLAVTVAPWGRVMAVKETGGRVVTSPSEAGELTPTRLLLPEGSYVITVRGPVQGSEVDLSVSVTVRSGRNTVLRLTLPGFDVEELIRSYVH